MVPPLVPRDGEGFWRPRPLPCVPSRSDTVVAPTRKARFPWFDVPVPLLIETVPPVDDVPVSFCPWMARETPVPLLDVRSCTLIVALEEAPPPKWMIEAVPSSK